MKSKEKNAVYLYWTLFIGIFMFLIWKCRYGLGILDETFYLTVPYRFCQGDSMFVDEWNMTQMFGILLIPFVKIYTHIAGGTDGIVYAFRILYVVIQAIVSAFIFHRIKKINIFGALFSSLGFFLYAPYNLSVLSYNTIAIMTLTLTLLIIMTNKKGILGKVELILSGIFFAMATLGCPFLAAMYIIYSVIVFLCAFIKRRKSISIDDSITVNCWSWVTLGIFLMFVTFAIFVLSRESLKDIISSFEQVMENSERGKAGFFYKSIVYFSSITYPKWSIAAFIPVLVSVFDKEREKRKSIYLCSECFVEFLWLLRLRYPNFIMLPVNILALQCVILYWNDKNIQELFLKIWVPGMLYTYLINLASNVKFYSISSASTVAFVSSVVIVVLTIKKNLNEFGIKKKLAYALVFVLVMQLVSETYYRYSTVYNGNKIRYQICEINDGPEKGLIASEESKDEYYKVYNVRDEIYGKFGTDKSILFLSMNSWDYLIFSCYENASLSAWLPTGVNDYSVNKLKKYYELNPKKFPNIVYIDNQYLEDLKHFESEFMFDSEQLSNGDYILYNVSKR